MNTREKLSWTLLGVALFFGIAAVSTDTSFFKNASLTGWLSLSGETNRLTVAGDALLLDGSAIGGGGESLWTTNSDGWITPAGGEYLTNTLVFKSGLADNATNVAAVVEAANVWTNAAPVLSLRSGGEELFGVHEFTTIIGKNTKQLLPNWDQSSGMKGYFDESEGDIDEWDFFLGATDGTGTSQGLVEADGDKSSAALTIKSVDDSQNESSFYFDTKQAGGQNESSIYVYSNNSETFVLSPAGNVTITGKIITQGGAASTPASAGATGTAGEIRWDSGFIYICVAANTWKRVAIATW